MYGSGLVVLARVVGLGMCYIVCIETLVHSLTRAPLPARPGLKVLKVALIACMLSS